MCQFQSFTPSLEEKQIRIQCRRLIKWHEKVSEAKGNQRLGDSCCSLCWMWITLNHKASQIFIQWVIEATAETLHISTHIECFFYISTHMIRPYVICGPARLVLAM